MTVKKYDASLIFNFLLTVVFCNLVFRSSSANEESLPCNLTKNIKGVCTVVTNCQLAMQYLEKGKLHPLKRCGFTDELESDEIVCCPTRSLVNIKGPEETTEIDQGTRDSTKRRSQKYCEEMSKDPMKNVEFHVIDGVDVTEGEFPHMAALGREIGDDISWICGGTIISKKFILTAAHCFTHIVPTTKVRVGVTRLNASDAQDFNIKNTTIHNDYQLANKHNDIALVEVDKEIKFNDQIYPACLYQGDDDPLGLIITGWGKTTTGQGDDRSIILQKAFVKAVDIKECNSILINRTMGFKIIDRTQLCAGAPPERIDTDACTGDSGGPCQIKNRLGTYSIVSIISYGQECGSKVPGVYTRVSAYLDWIEKYVWDE